MTRPNIQIPKEFAINGEKADFTQEKIQTGFDKLNPDIFAGDNANKFIDDTYKGLNGVLDLYNGIVLHDMTTTYDDKAVVGKFIENSFKLYRSLVNNNTGHEVTETEYWEEVALGGGGGLENKITNCILEAPNGVATYSGSTITVKQGLKVLIPNGRNADGTLKNIERTLTQDENLTITGLSPDRTTYALLVYPDNLGIRRFLTTCQKFNDLPTSVTDQYSWGIYCEETNLAYMTSGSTTANWQPLTCAHIGIFYGSESTIEYFNPFETINLLKQSDKSQISGWGMPSNKYIDLTLGASGSTYTAPANGWYFLSFNTASKDDGMIMYASNNYSVSGGALAFAGWKQCIIPVRKGEPCNITYQRTGTDYETTFRFIYAEGSK